MNQIQIRILHDRKKEASKTKAALIQLEVTHERKRKFISTGIKVCKGQFKNGRIVQHGNADSLNNQIQEQIKEIEAFVHSYNEQNAIFTLESLDHINDGYKEIDNSFLEWFEKRIHDRYIEYSTKLQHKKVLNFLKDEYKQIQLFRDLTPAKLQAMDEYLHHRNIGTKEQPKYMQQTSIHVYHKVLKHYINEAKIQGIMDINPYDRLKFDRGTSKPRIVLSMEEINKIRNYTTTSMLNAKVRDLFIFQCYTGLAYTDMMAIDFTKKEFVNNQWIIKDERNKTGIEYFMTLLPPVVEILNRYGGKLPHLSYDVYNRNLKAVASASGVTKHVTTHIGRHTFATTIALGSGIPIEIVAKMLGHTDIKTTQLYAKIMPKQVLEGFEQIKLHIS